MFLPHVFVCMVILLVTFQSAITLQCYECDSPEEPGCGEPFKNKKIHTVECPSDTLCQKVKHPTLGGADEPITRGCYNDSLCTNLSVCLECDSHLCNSSNTLSPIFIFGFLAAMVLIRQYY